MEASVTIKMSPSQFDALREAVEAAKEEALNRADDREFGTAAQRGAERAKAMRFTDLLRVLR